MTQSLGKKFLDMYRDISSDTSSDWSTNDVSNDIPDKVLISNTNYIITHVKLLHCNIINYMPLCMAKIIIENKYIVTDIKKYINGIKVIIDNELYDIDALSVPVFAKLKQQIILASALAQFPTDCLELYTPHTDGMGV